MQDSRNRVYTRQYVVETLRHLGLQELADTAMKELPDRLDTEQLWNWGMQYGVTKDQLLSRLGASP